MLRWMVRGRSRFAPLCPCPQRPPPSDISPNVCPHSVQEWALRLASWLDFHRRSHSVGSRFAKFCKDTGLLTPRFTPTDVDLVFTRVCARGKRKISFDGFEAALGEIALKKGVEESALRQLVAASDGPATSCTAAESGGVLDKLTDTSQYTGAHKQRFDADGRGRGLAGRDAAPKGKGMLIQESPRNDS